MNTTLRTWGTRALAAFGTAAVLGTMASTPAHALDATNLTMIEGQGISNVVTINQTRSDLISTLRSIGRDNGNCNTASTCSFRLSNDTASVEVEFASERVNLITVVQTSVMLDKRWVTTAGVTDPMPPADVQALYPGSTRVDYPGDTRIVANNQGYTYHWNSFCSNGFCSVRTYHEIYAPGSANVDGSNPGADSVAWSGAIQVRNGSNKSGTYRLSVVVTAPNGSKQTISDSVSVGRRSWLVVAPSSYLDASGQLGTYTYRAELRDNRGRLVGSNNGSFWLVTT